MLTETSYIWLPRDVADTVLMLALNSPDQLPEHVEKAVENMNKATAMPGTELSVAAEAASDVFASYAHLSPEEQTQTLTQVRDLLDHPNTTHTRNLIKTFEDLLASHNHIRQHLCSNCQCKDCREQ